MMLFLFLLQIAYSKAQINPYETNKNSKEEDNPQYSGICGSAANYSFSPTKGELTITGRGEIINYDKDDSPPWASFRSDIKIITINYGISSTGMYSFAHFNEITEISFPESVKHISAYSFYNCTKLSSVTIPNKVEILFPRAFEGCISLTTISIPNSIIEIRESCFSNSGLKSISIPGNVYFVYDNAFFNCTELESVTIADEVPYIFDGCFSYCTKLKSIKIPQKAEVVYSYVFSNCHSLENVILHSDIKITGAAFAFCYSLKSITIYENTNFTGNCFLYCTALTNIILPNTVSEFSDKLFDSCIQLESIQIPDSLKTIGKSTFTNCISLKSIDIPNSVTSIGDLAFNNCTSLHSISIGNSVTTIGSSTFCECISLTKIDIPNSVITVNESAFINCTSLETITLSNSLKSLEYDLFLNCISLKELTIPQSVTSIKKRVLNNCTNIETLKIFSSTAFIFSEAFLNCPKLNDVYFNGTKNPGEQTNAFVNCPNLQYVKVPSDYTDQLFCKIPVKKDGDLPISPSDEVEEPFNCTTIDTNCVECNSSSKTCTRCSYNYVPKNGRCVFDLNRCYYKIKNCLSCAFEDENENENDVICTKCQNDEYVLSNDKKECIKLELTSCEVIGCSSCYKHDQTKCIKCNTGNNFESSPINGQCHCKEGYTIDDIYCLLTESIDEISPSVVIDFSDSNLVQFSSNNSVMTLNTENFKTKDHSDDSIYIVSIPKKVTKIEIPENDLHVKLFIKYNIKQEEPITLDYKQSEKPLIIKCQGNLVLNLPPENNMEIIAESNLTINSMNENDNNQNLLLLEDETKEISIKKVTLGSSIYTTYVNSLDSNITIEELYIDSSASIHGQTKPLKTSFSKVVIKERSTLDLINSNADTIIIEPFAKINIRNYYEKISNISIIMNNNYYKSSAPINYYTPYPRVMNTSIEIKYESEGSSIYFTETYAAKFSGAKKKQNLEACEKLKFIPSGNFVSYKCKADDDTDDYSPVFLILDYDPDHNKKYSDLPTSTIIIIIVVCVVVVIIIIVVLLVYFLVIRKRRNKRSSSTGEEV